MSTTQLRTLRRLAADPEVSPRVARRAGQALAAADGDPDRTATKWLERFLAEGPDGLRDAPRSGRPTQLSAEAARRVLMEPLFIASAKWSSRTVAEAAGISQPSVVRLWGKAYAADVLADLAPWDELARSCRPTGVRIGPQGCVLVLARVPTGRPARATGRAAERGLVEDGVMRSPLRPLMQTVLAGALVRVGAVDGALDDADLPDFVEESTPNRHLQYLIVCDEPATSALPALDPRAQVVTVPTRDWQALLPHLVTALSPGTRPVLETIAHRVREWATGGPTSGFSWTAASPEADGVTGPVTLRGPSLLLAPAQRLTESITEAIMAGLRTGRLRGGDPLTERYLAQATHTSRSQVQEALRMLAMEGVVELRDDRTAVVPMPSGDDVMETYAMRRAVGGLAMAGAATNWRPGQLGSLLQGMTTLREVAATGDVRATDDADLDFQDVLASASNLRRVLITFRRLTIQVKMFTTVMGLKYAYSIDDILTDDTAILDAIRHRDPAAARRLWDQKMEAAARYMMRQLERAD